MDWSDYYDLEYNKLLPSPGDSNEVVVAKGFVRLYRDMDGDSQEMSMREIHRLEEMALVLESAIEVLKARDLL